MLFLSGTISTGWKKICGLVVFNINLSSICKTLEGVLITLTSERYYGEDKGSCSMNKKSAVGTRALFFGTCWNNTHFWLVLVAWERNENPCLCLTIIFFPSFIMWGGDEVKAISWSKHSRFDDLMREGASHTWKRYKQYLHSPCWSEIPVPVLSFPHSHWQLPCIECKQLA